MTTRWTTPDVWIPDELASAIFIPSGMTRPPLATNQSQHRRELKEKLVCRDTRCRACGRRWSEVVAIHMHEAILSKADVMGWKKKLRGQINIEANCILLCEDCHLGLGGKSPPTRLEVLEQHVQMYGLGVVRWLRSLPFKAHPLKGLLEQYP